MLIVLEGCDGTGKTTLAQMLSQVLHADILHCTTLTPNTFEFFEEIIQASRERNIIADRFCYGQFVYQDGDDRNLTLEQLYSLEIQMLAAGAKVIHVTASESSIRQRLERRNEITTKPIRHIISGFKAIFKMSLMSITEYDTSAMEEED